MKEIISYEQLKDSINKLLEEGATPDCFIIGKPKEDTIIIAGKEFIVVEGESMGSVDGMKIYVDRKCPPGTAYLIDSKNIIEIAVTEKEEIQITNDGIDLMEKLGGSFVRSLAEAWYHADGVNKNRLEHNFPYFEEYELQAQRAKKRDEKE